MMEIKETHEIWKAHFHNDSFPERDISCKKKWIALDDFLKVIDDIFECRFIPKALGLNHCKTVDCIWCDYRIELRGKLNKT